MPESQQTWTEEDSRVYRELAAVAVPAREEQIATLLSLLPFSEGTNFRAVELGCGEGGSRCARVMVAYPRRDRLAIQNRMAAPLCGVAATKPLD